MPAALQLAQDAFARHLALEMLDGSLDTLVTDLDFKGFALNGFAGIRQGTGDMADRPPDCKLLCLAFVWGPSPKRRAFC